MRHWQANGLKPHILRGFKVSRDPKFVEKLEDIVSTPVAADLVLPPRLLGDCLAWGSAKPCRAGNLAARILRIPAPPSARSFALPAFTPFTPVNRFHSHPPRPP